MNTYSLTNPGKERKDNQDSFSNYFHTHFSLFVIADGMGGHNAGEVASKLASEEIQSYIINHKDMEFYDLLLKRAIEHANDVIYQESLSHEEYTNMGTTIVAILVHKEKMYLAHVGDSRCYLFRAGKMEQLTEDHSLVRDLISRGLLDPEEAVDHPDRNVITRALGTNAAVDVDLQVVDLEEGDRLILCSDGLTNMVSIEEMSEVLLKENSARLACELLVELANENGGQDNITITIYEYRS